MEKCRQYFDKARKNEKQILGEKKSLEKLAHTRKMDKMRRKIEKRREKLRGREGKKTRKL